ncbi:hypothetical protein E2C01_020825 [Portunus trituberculatus]|uniref:Uncharacterized protein n=1 Tax=Portunus trituberculatus TaxID=210409 RepID=A0A5B7E2N2_PORTR|nr:hypothetical protein [Portunus trituberculatus]
MTWNVDAGDDCTRNRVANAFKEEMQSFARIPKCSSHYSRDVSWPLGKILLGTCKPAILKLLLLLSVSAL